MALTRMSGGAPFSRRASDRILDVRFQVTGGPGYDRLRRGPRSLTGRSNGPKKSASVRLRVGNGLVLTPPDPLDLPASLVEISANQDEAADVEFFGGREILERRFGVYTLMDFVWEGLGPTSSWAGFQVADLGPTGALICWQTEIPPDVAPVLIRGGDDQALWSDFLLDLFADNGQSYGIYVLGGPPSEITNRRADLLPAATVRQACRLWLDRASEENETEWVELRDFVIACMEQPNSLTRSSELLQKLTRLGPEGYLEATKPPPTELAGDDRRLILDNYFELTYRESDQPKTRAR